MNAVVLGALSLDRYVVVRAFPEEDSMVFADSRMLFTGGSGANIAVNLAISGLSTHFFCGTGDDASGLTLISKLEQNAVKVHADKREGSSAETLIIVDRNGKRRIISFGGNALYDGEIDKSVEADLVCVADAFPEKALQFFKHYEGCRKIYVPGGCGLYFGSEHIRRVAAKSDITILSSPESVSIGSGFDSISTVVIVTRGAEPTEIFCRDGKMSVPVEPVQGEIIDTTGAGDAFASGFIVEYRVSGALESAVKAGQRLASGVILVYGANMGALCQWDGKEREDAE
ncbi:MAG: carbohydrate kinase family protein [Vulcanimicrobiota bacterium]